MLPDVAPLSAVLLEVNHATSYGCMWLPCAKVVDVAHDDIEYELGDGTSGKAGDSDWRTTVPRPLSYYLALIRQGVIDHFTGAKRGILEEHDLAEHDLQQCEAATLDILRLISPKCLSIRSLAGGGDSEDYLYTDILPNAQDRMSLELFKRGFPDLAAAFDVFLGPTQDTSTAYKPATSPPPSPEQQKSREGTPFPTDKQPKPDTSTAYKPAGSPPHLPEPPSPQGTPIPTRKPCPKCGTRMLKTRMGRLFTLTCPSCQHEISGDLFGGNQSKQPEQDTSTAFKPAASKQDTSTAFTPAASPPPSPPPSPQRPSPTATTEDRQDNAASQRWYNRNVTLPGWIVRYLPDANFERIGYAVIAIIVVVLAVTCFLNSNNDSNPWAVAPGPLPPEAPLPEHGHGIYNFDKAATTSFLQIRPRRADQHLVVKVYQERTLVCWFFMRAGESYQTLIPPGRYALKIGYGQKWFGEAHFFGPDGTYREITNLPPIQANTNYLVDLTPAKGGTLKQSQIVGKHF